jgi:protoporphyrinogen oxidase
MTSSPSVICIGAGPAGLTAAYLLAKQGAQVTILEQDPTYVGGISRTATYKGFAFDIGGHRFFSKSQEVEDLWVEIMGADFLDRPRKSRIYYKHLLFDYPLRAFDALSKLGLGEATRCVASYVKVRLQPSRPARNFEEWVTAKFGRRLFEIFFRTYTEKVWGMKCTDISADWAAQRIKGLSLSKAIWHALMPQRSTKPRHKMIKTLADSFRYPRRGPGMLWEAAAAKTRSLGGSILMGQEVTGVERTPAHGWLIRTRDNAGTISSYRADHVISSMPLRALAQSLAPALPSKVREASIGLRYRDFIVVAIILKDRNVFDDNWIYIHDPDVKVGRIQNFKSWSPEMVPEPGLTCYGMEYFCFENDGLWNSADSELIRLAMDELIRLGLASEDDIVEGTVVRQPKAYPVYDDQYKDRVATIRNALDTHYPGLHLVGRNGMHKYNNQDHAMMTAMLTVKNILAGRMVYDVWRVNQDAEYHEETQADIQQKNGTERHPGVLGGRLVPLRSQG